MVHLLKELEDYAEKNNVPIMQKEGISFMTEYIKEKKYVTILEIGTAIGYSAIQMALISPSIHVVTLERNDEMYEKATENIKKFHLENQIKVIKGDALEVLLEENFDFIFIDAAKSQYIKFFEKFKNLLNENGTILSDNLAFHGLVQEDTSTMSRNVRGLVTKLRNYIDFLKNNPDFDTKFYSLGDGLAITTKKS